MDANTLAMKLSVFGIRTTYYDAEGVLILETHQVASSWIIFEQDVFGERIK